MKAVRLLKLVFKNFQSFKDFIFEPNGKSANIYGRNKLGKTTTANGQSWLLFDKDILGNAVGKNFNIYPLDENNKPISGLQVDVEGRYDIDGKVVTLRKVYAEKWSAKKGSIEKEFKGHETTHYIDGVPVKKNEYDAFINSIASQETLKLLTLPGFFNDDKQFPWQKRRNLLVDVSGGISDEEIIASDAKLAKLPEILQGRDIDKHKEVIKARHSELNKAIEQIPARIDEVYLGLPDTNDTDTIIIAKKYTLQPDDEMILKLKAIHAKKHEELALIQSGGEIAQKKIELANIEAELQTIRNEFQQKIDEQVGKKRTTLTELQMKIDYQLKRQIGDLEKTVKDNVAKIETNKIKAAQLRVKFGEEKAKVLEFTQETVCPTCQQSIPEEQLAAAKETATANFNQQKAEKLSEIQTQGKALMAEVEELENKNVELNEQITGLKTQIEEAQLEVIKLQAEINKINEDNELGGFPPAEAEKMREKAAVEEAILNIQSGNSEAVTKAKAEIAEVEGDIKTMEEAQKKLDDHAKGMKRIDELKGQEKTLSAEYTKLEGELFLIDLFNRKKASMLEGKVGDRFKMARFKLFNQLVNGSLDECCETISDGVPYGGGLNTGSRILVDVDIINVLSEHFGLSMPVFVDNREALTEPIFSASQTIGLVATPGEDSLRIDIIDGTVKEVA